ncbi:Hypothetical predicted protein [Olea europaea subsp. europaea]|uniref:Uncharacterized protein n=1 Tax=Olea europaea subsp. europaea TaxID=158383 RepID=A0A8S0RXN3_OLEEU|nr:Hypothetical predicted protein [Olea europaea subsp. europaea]
MSRMRPSRGRDAARFSGIYWKFMGPDVQAMSGTHHGHGNVRDASRPRQGCSLVSRQFSLVSGARCVDHVQDTARTHPDFHAMSGTRHGHGKDKARFSGNFVQFLGYGVQSISRMRQGHILTFRKFLGCIGAVVGMQPNFQALLGNFWDTVALGATLGCSLIFRHSWDFLGMVCMLCPGRVLAAIGMQPNFQAFVGSLWARPCSRCVMAKVGTEPDFQAILGSFVDTVCRLHPGCSKDASRLSSIFGQFLEHDV